MLGNGPIEPDAVMAPFAREVLARATMDYAKRWGIEPMSSDFKSRGFGIEHTHIQHPDHLARLLLVMALALPSAVSTGPWDAEHHPTPAEKNA